MARNDGWRPGIGPASWPTSARVAAALVLLVAGVVGLTSGLRHASPAPQSAAATGAAAAPATVTVTATPRVAASSTAPTVPITPAAAPKTVSPAPSSSPTTADARRLTPPPPVTRVTVTRWDSDVRIVGTAGLDPDGGCQASNVLQRTDAYRCFGDDSMIYDPCFPTPGGAVCPSEPWSRDVTVLRVDGDPGEVTGSMTAGLPWGVELADGQRCAFLGGATDAIGKLRLNYACPHGEVFGEPARGRTWWVQERDQASSRLHRVALTRVWF